MDDDLGPVLIAAGAVCLCALGASLWLCLGLSEVLRLPACDTLLSFTLRVSHTVATIFQSAKR